MFLSASEAMCVGEMMIVRVREAELGGARTMVLASDQRLKLSDVQMKCVKPSVKLR